MHPPGSRQRRLLRLVPVLLLPAAFVAVLWYALGIEPAAPSPLEGRVAPPFTLRLFDGGAVSLEALRGQVVLVNFWASWCVPCRQEAPYLEAAWRAYRARGFVLVGVNVWDAETDARAYIREFGHTFPNGMDRSGAIAIAYGVRGVPESFFIDRAGRIARRHVGPLTPERIRALVEPLLAGGRAVEP